ncbi:MAG: hypothetical protein MIO88_01205 [Methanoregulaceae archaeon]|nr:hypothetical protein [Methanoregulaceae archaeon]
MLLDAIPLLFLTPEEYRNKLAQELDTLYYTYRHGGASSNAQFTTGVEAINKMIVESETRWDSRTKDQIRAFRSEWRGFDERISALEQAAITKKHEKVKKVAIAPEPESVPDPAMRVEIPREQVIKYITEHPGEMVKEIIAGTGIPPSTCKRIITNLCADETIRKEGKNRFRYYPTNKNGSFQSNGQDQIHLKEPSTGKKVTDFIITNPGCNVKDMSIGTGISSFKCGTAASALCTKKLIRRDGTRTRYRYYPIE